MLYGRNTERLHETVRSINQSSQSTGIQTDFHVYAAKRTGYKFESIKLDL